MSSSNCHNEEKESRVKLVFKSPTKCYVFTMDVNDTVSALYKRIGEMDDSIDSRHYGIYLCGSKKQLRDGICSLKEYGVGIRRPEYLYARKYRCFVAIEWKSEGTTLFIKRLNGKAFKLDEVKRSDLIIDVKKRIEEKVNIHHSLQTLSILHKTLVDDQSLKEQSIPEYSTICLNIKPKCMLKLNRLLCDEDVSLMTTTMRKGNCYYGRMLEQWNKSSHLRGTHLEIERVLEIRRNYDRNMSVYNAIVKSKAEDYSRRTCGKRTSNLETVLFHGTSIENIHKIVYGGFNRDFNVMSKYGKGCYFTNKAIIASLYSTKFELEENVYAMLASIGYTGQFTIGYENINSKDLYMQDSVTEYDSLVNDLFHPSIFVINRDYHVVPLFVIVFSIEKKSK